MDDMSGCHRTERSGRRNSLKNGTERLDCVRARASAGIELGRLQNRRDPGSSEAAKSASRENVWQASGWEKNRRSATRSADEAESIR